jgi:hypothetical protein
MQGPFRVIIIIILAAVGFAIASVVISDGSVIMAKVGHYIVRQFE